MSDQQLRIQHDETVARNREHRLATMQEAQRLADQRRNQQTTTEANR